MKHTEEVLLISDTPFDWGRLHEVEKVLNERNIELKLRDIDKYCLEKCKKLIKEKGPSDILSTVELTETVLPKTPASNKGAFNLLIKTLRETPIPEKVV